MPDRDARSVDAGVSRRHGYLFRDFADLQLKILSNSPPNLESQILYDLLLESGETCYEGIAAYSYGG
jgi:hypothetical protein